MIHAQESISFPPSCTVIICTRDRPRELDRCLDAVSRLIYSQFDVLVVDNGSRRKSAQEVAARWGVRYIVEPAVGLSRARNRGARICSTDIVAYLDDDAIPEAGWLSNLVREFKDPLVMAAAGRIPALDVDADDDRTYATIVGLSHVGGMERRVIDRDTLFWFEIANFGGVCIGANMAFRRSAFDLWPGFDERLGLGAPIEGNEEYHAFFSLIDRGYRFVYTPSAVAHHPCGPRSLKDLRQRYLRQKAAAAGYITLLFFENPCYRRTILKFVAQRLADRARIGRHRATGPCLQIAPWWRVMVAWISGPLMYAMTKFETLASKYSSDISPPR